MRRVISGVVSGVSGLALVCATAHAAQAQRLAERYIPIGQSPGVSGVSSVTGEVTAIDLDRSVMTVAVDDEPMSFVMAPTTSVWLDRSQAREPSETVGYAGLRVGDVVEVKRGDAEAVPVVAGGEEGPIADWIKIDEAARRVD